MIHYDDLRKLAEAAKDAMDSCTSPPMDWTDFDFCQEIFSGQWTAYIVAVNPSTILRLLDIIDVAKRALKMASYSTTLAKIAKIEKED